MFINKWINPVRTLIFVSNLLHASRVQTILSTLDVFDARLIGKNQDTNKHPMQMRFVGLVWPERLLQTIQTLRISQVGISPSVASA